MSLASNIHELLMGGSSGYSIANSLRFRSSASAYLSRTPSVAGNRQTWTWSGWVKRGAISQTNYRAVFGGGETLITFYDDSTYNSQLIVNLRSAGSNVFLNYAPVFRDASAWYHFVFACDTTQATSSNRFKLYVNGVQITAAGSLGLNYPSQNWNTDINAVASQTIGGVNYFDGYLANINFIDGQALPPTAFGTINKENGVWSPITYTGTYGTNGFRLNFSNGTSTTTLGYDSSGNGNNWTTNNISLTAGSTYDWMIDSPTKFPGSSYGVGNYCVLNAVSIGTDCTLSDGNLGVAYGSATTRYSTMGTIGMSSGKWYAEFSYTGGTSPNPIIGVSSKASATDMIYYVGYNSYGWGYEGTSGFKYTNGSGVAYGATWTTNDIIGIAFDADAGTLTFYKNNISQGTAFTGLTSGPYYFGVGDGGGASTFTGWINFGQRPFAYTPPSGYKTLCTQNLPGVTIQNGAQYMAATTYTGNGSTQSISNAVNSVSFQPDFVWIKRRNLTANHQLYDSIRGVQKALYSDLTSQELTQTGGITAFLSNGITVGSDAGVNGSGDTQVAWNWKAGGTAVTNTAGSITSSVSANPTAGFSVVTYTCQTSGSGTIGHGLGVAPSMIISKGRGTVTSWGTYHVSNGWNGYLVLNGTNAFITDPNGMNNTAPTSNVWTQGSTYAGIGTMVAYCFAAIPGYSAFGSYTGNGSTDGPFVYCGFRPRFILIKNAAATGDWTIMDTSRDTYNAMITALYPNLSNSESGGNIDALSNGFKVRNTTYQNGSGNMMIYAAFAENPFSYSLAR